MGTAFTLTTAPLAPLERFYEEADAELPATSPAVTELSLEERTRLLQSKTDYLGLLKHPGFRVRKISPLRSSTVVIEAVAA